MAIVASGSTNLAAIGVPNVIVQITPPNPLLNGVPTNIIGVVGVGSWGPVNAPTTVGSIQQQVATFGAPLNVTYDMGTQVYNAYLQGANNFVCVRVTDGTDVAASCLVQDTSTATGLILSALYTGVVGNTLNASVTVGSNSTSTTPTYRLNVWLTGGVPESFDNIVGTGATLWANIANAVNLGQGPQRGPSDLVRAGQPGTFNVITVTVPGSYTAIPTVTATIGSGATFAVHMQAISATVDASNLGTGYAIGDTITLTGGTGTEPILTVLSIGGGGAVGLVAVTTPGNLTVLAANPVSQGSTSGSGSGAKFNLAYGLLSVTPSGGTGYSQFSQLIFSGNGGGAVTFTFTTSASIIAPYLNKNFTFANGTNGNSSVNDLTLIGSDTMIPRRGMYALRNTNASIGILADQTDSANSNWNNQAAFGASEGIYMIGVMANSYSNNINGAVALKQTVGVVSYDFKLMLGDWCQIFDPFNNVNRFVSPAGFVAGILATQLPDNSSLNKVMNGIIVTQKTFNAMTYSNADLQALQAGGIDVITSPIPQSMTQYGVRLGINTSGNITTIGDNYTRMINFLAQTFNQGLGGFIGLPQTIEVQSQARATLQTFLQNIQQLGMIGTLNGNPAYQVILDSTNNPPTQVALGYMQANVQVTLWSIIFQFIVNLQAGQSVNVQVLPPQLI